MHGQSLLRLKLARGLWKQGSNDQRPCGVRSGSTFMGRGPLAFSGCMGQCAFAYNNLSAVECPREAWALRRALFEEKADGPQGVGSVWAQHPSRNSESACLDWVCT